MKKKNHSDIILVVLPILLIVITAIAVFATLSTRNKLNQYKNQLKFFDDRYVCEATYHDTNVILASDNQNKLRVLLADYHNKLLLKEPVITDTITFVFTNDNIDWKLDISKTENDYLKIDLVGSKEFHFYMQESDRFERIVRLASPDGWDVPNRLMANKKK